MRVSRLLSVGWHASSFQSRFCFLSCAKLQLPFRNRTIRKFGRPISQEILYHLKTKIARVFILIFIPFQVALCFATDGVWYDLDIENERYSEYVHCVKLFRQQVTKTELETSYISVRTYQHQTNNNYKAKQKVYP